MNDGGSPSVIGCTFTGNLAPYGSGLSNTRTNAYIESCTFADSNSAGIGGGGIYNVGARHDQPMPVPPEHRHPLGRRHSG